MKHQILYLAMTLSLTATAKDKVVDNPAFSKGGMSFRPKMVIMGKNSTTIGFKVRGSSWRLAEESHLVADGKTYRMTKATVFTRTKDGTVTGYEALDPSKNYSNKEDSVCAEFEPLDPKVKVFDFFEEEYSSFNTSGIRLDGKRYPFVLGKPKPYPYSKDEPLCPIEPKYGKAKYTCNIYRPDGTAEKAVMFGLNNCFSGDRFLDFTKNGYQIEASRPYNALVGAPYPDNQFPLMMIPGYETIVSVDEAAYIASKLGMGKKKIPMHQIIQFEGPLADLEQVHYDERGIYYEFERYSPDSLWTALQNKIKNIENNKNYSRRQKDYGRLRAETYYLWHYMRFVKDSLVGIQDIHAADLEILKDGRSFYTVNGAGLLNYAHANHIGGVFTEWMEGFAKAMNMAKRMRNMELMPEAAFDTIPQIYHKELKAMNDSTRTAIERLREKANEVKVMETPNCTGEEFIGKVVRENPGVVLFFDFWATWCGPCMNGIREMEPLKAELAGRPIRFVYVTNESSPANQWTKQINSMPGIHYRLPNDIWNQIPKLSGIPQYYIYDKQGNLFYEQTGFGVIDPLKEKIEEAIGK